MKQKSQVQRWLSAAAFGLMVSWSATTTMAAVYTNILVESFDGGDSPARVTPINGNTTTTLDWSTEDADGSNNSGSLKVTVDWIYNPSQWQETQLNLQDPTPWPGLGVPPYFQIEYDVRAVSGDPDTNGTYGTVQAIGQGWANNGPNGDPSAVNWVTLGRIPLTSTNWQHIAQSLDTFQPYNLNNIVINFVAQYSVTSSVTYLVDNIEIAAATNGPPTLTLGPPPVSGLHLVTPSTGASYQRQNIRTLGTNFMWYNAAGPVTYSVTIGKYPDSTVYSNLETHVWLVPGWQPTNPDADWTARSVIRLDIANDPDGSGVAIFRYKTNAPNTNGNYYVDNPYSNAIPGSSILGTWSLTFNQNTNVTVTAPGGMITNFVLLPEIAAYFDTNNLRVYFGAQAGNDTNRGQEVILTGAQVTGAPGSISDNFQGLTLDTNKWQKAAQVQGNVYQVLGSAFTISWLLPDNLFSFIVATNLAISSPWQNSELSSSSAGGKKTVAVPKGYPGPSQGYFGMEKRTATKLLALLPGETYAPGTTAGKTGAPTAQTAGVGFQVVVKTVDDKNYQVFSTDTVWLETPGDTNTLTFGWVPQLILGSASFNVTNSTPGTWTIRAADQTDTNNIADHITGPYTVN